jgi:hypothetical protein
MILLAATSKSERAVYALLFRQLAQTARAIHDMQQATNDLRRVRGLSLPSSRPAKPSKPALQTTPCRPSRARWKTCANSIRKPAKKPSAHGSSPNGRGAAHPFQPHSRGQRRHCSRQGRPCRKNQAETTIGNQASSDRGEARERSRRNGRSSGWRAAHRADGRGPYRRVNSRLLADKHQGTPATAAVAQKPSLAKTTRLAKQSGQGKTLERGGLER